MSSYHRQKGSTFERTTADYLAEALDDDGIDRQVKTGNKDKGDVRGVKIHGQRIAVETKNYGGRLLPAAWVEEARIEAGNLDALCGVVIAKRKGTTAPGEQWVLMTVDDLVALITGERRES